MNNGFLSALTLVSVIGCGAVAGVFFAFSTFVMKALGQLPPAQGIAAMQAINRAAPTPLFMVALFGMGVSCASLVVTAFFVWNEPWAIPLLVGGSIYVLGIITITTGYHVPRNDALAKVDPRAAGAWQEWLRYRSSWTALNHVRTVAALAAAVALTIALRL